MDINLSAEDKAFRDEVGAFFDAQFDDTLVKTLQTPGGKKQGLVEWHKRLYKQGWIAPDWPEEYGGTGWTLTQRYIFDTERAMRGIPAISTFGDVSPFSLQMVGPVIYTFGTDEQKRRFLPRILSGDDWWCQGYSEPGAGSDLAALQTKAERDGDDYIVDGTKIWTSYAHYADWIFCLVRTSNEGKKQQGISFLLMDMTSPGITVSPIHSIDGVHSLNEVRFDNVRVPIANRIGEENKGWTYAKSLLVHERNGLAGVGIAKYKLETIRQQARAEKLGSGSVLDDPDFSARLAAIEIDLMALEFTELRTLADSASGKGPGAASSLLKLRGTEILQALEELHMDLAAYYSGIEFYEQNDGLPGHDFADRARREYMYGRASTIFGGSSEVQRNITAKHVLGL